MRITHHASRIYVLLAVFIALSTLYSIAVPPFEASDELWHYPMVKYIADNWALPVQDPENVGPWRQEGSQPPLYYFIGAVATFWIDTSDVDVVRHLNPHADNGVATADGNVNLITHHPETESFPWRGTTLAVHLIRFLSVLMGAATVYLTYRLTLELGESASRRVSESASRRVSESASQRVSESASQRDFGELPWHSPALVTAGASGPPGQVSRAVGEWRNVALVAAAINAFTPMFLFISGAVNNDNLVVPLCSLALLLMVRMARGEGREARGEGREARGERREARGEGREARGEGRGAAQHATRNAQHVSRFTFHVSRFTLLGLIVGLALLTKESAGGLVLLTALTVAYVAWRERSWRTFLVGGLATGVPTLLVAGWWYLRNWRLYGDPLGQNVFIEILGQRDVPADLAQLWRERISFMRGYWGNFGGLNVPMAEWAYTALDVFMILAALGLLLAVARRGKSANLQICKSVSWLIVLLWPVLVVVLWVIWATTTWSSQGRLIFSAISVWSLLLALGWRALTSLLPSRARAMGARATGARATGARATGARASLAPTGNLRSCAFISVPIFMFIVSLIAPFAWIRPAYARPPALTDEQIAAIPQRVDAVFFHPAGGQLKLLGYDAPGEAAYPGEPVPITLYWEAIEPFERDYSIFLHLVDQYDLVTAQRDAFPGMGTLSTQWLESGYRWSERRVLALPDTAYSPNQTVFEVGLYDYNTLERLAVVDATGQIAGDHVRFGQVDVLSHSGDWPNPISVDFGGKMELVGYHLDRRALRPGEVTTLTLYWRARRSMKTNYSISTQFVDANQVKAAQKDAWPLDGAAPTSIWQPGELIEEHRELTIFDDAPTGVYDVYVAAYPADDPDALLVVTPPGGRLQTDHVVLTTIRVLP